MEANWILQNRMKVWNTSNQEILIDLIVIVYLFMLVYMEFLRKTTKIS